MPAEQLENAGYYGSTSAQYQVDIQADGTLTMSYLNYPTSIPAQTFTYCSDGSFRDSTGLSYISFVKERNGQTYLYQQAVSPLPGLGALPIANYAAVKLPENDLSPEVAAAWDSIATLGILPMNEPYNSQTFLALADAAAVAEVPETIPGYIGAAGSRTRPPPALRSRCPAWAAGTAWTTSWRSGRRPLDQRQGQPLHGRGRSAHAVHWLRRLLHHHSGGWLCPLVSGRRCRRQDHGPCRCRRIPASGCMTETAR